ncbi:tRNA (adenine(22)-N(1))-methyltransferase [Shewanella waksmanii]|uniref:tRNA (adenine(22)-N(1))-methyltransferase n=1 Tax=Shewanella waksmanii TaxID=213783 RepID=UPI00373556B9
MKLSRRLKAIANLIGPQPAQVWDCCCDHGYLGAALLSRGHKVHFVDVVADITDALTVKLNQFFAVEDKQSPPWTVHCIDVAQLPLANYPTKRPVIIVIAGIGGELMRDLLLDLQPVLNQLNAAISLILCPVNHAYLVRAFLSEQVYYCDNELLIEENKRFYEIMHITTQPNRQNQGYRVSKVGRKIWQSSHLPANLQDIAKRYHCKLISHYQRQLIGANKAADVIEQQRLQTILSAYGDVTLD